LYVALSSPFVSHFFSSPSPAIAVSDRDIALSAHLNRIPDTYSHFLSLYSFFLSSIAVGCSIILFFLIGEPYERGFFCNDESLLHPYHSSTVKHWMLFLFGVVLPVVLVSISYYSF
jgi:hypothetical protein